MPWRDAALHLTLDVARMNRAAGVLRNGGAQDLNFAGIRIDFDVDQRGGESADRRRAQLTLARPTTGPPVRANVVARVA